MISKTGPEIEITEVTARDLTVNKEMSEFPEPQPYNEEKRLTSDPSSVHI